MAISTATWEIVWGVGLIILSIALAKLFVYIISRYAALVAKKTATVLDDMVIEAVKKPLYYLIILVGADVAVQSVTSLSEITSKLDSIIYVGEVLAGAYFVSKTVRVFARWYAKNIAAKAKSRFDDEFLPLFNRTADVFIYGSSIVIILDFFGYNITAIVAGLGIAGLAFALAAQETLSNMISGFVIMADRPFRVNDIIELSAGEYGEVSEIGLRSTKILTMDLTMIVVPNSQIGSSQITNYSYPDNRLRLKIPVGVAYGTDLKTATKALKEVARKQRHVLERPAPRVHLTSFSDFSLSLVLYVWIDSHKDRFEVINRINRAIDERFKKDGIEIPFPIQTVRIQNK
ncbi:mechanosensitive channel MscK precursor [archaeon BMS3Bbin16]|nr:mechanosensitive channel MscK precursor [archaeon BMS3Bbin16]